jgi:hypothetical protein
MSEDSLGPAPGAGRWEQLNRCPECGADMARMPQVGEQIGLYYRCAAHGRFRYSWDQDALERVPEAEK